MGHAFAGHFMINDANMLVPQNSSGIAHGQ
jgi:hypothetical protein